MNKDAKVYLNDILESIMQIEKYTKKVSANKFNQNI